MKKKTHISWVMEREKKKAAMFQFDVIKCLRMLRPFLFTKNNLFLYTFFLPCCFIVVCIRTLRALHSTIESIWIKINGNEWECMRLCTNAIKSITSFSSYFSRIAFEMSRYAFVSFGLAWFALVRFGSLQFQ